MSHLISVAPMMDCTDQHERYFLRLIAPHIRLYTEMITTQALLQGKNPERFLAFHAAEHPVALQLGGHEPAKLAACARMGADAGFDEINLNVGCPSDRVRSGRFGACLMLEPERVAESVAAMCAQVNIPVTVKCRIGIDEKDAYVDLQHFVEVVKNAGCNIFIIHARKCINGFNPKQNRNIPPLRYDVVQQIKRDFPQLKIIVNGGIKTVADVDAQLAHVDGVMLGRAAYANPYLLAELSQKYFATQKILTRREVIQHFIPYVRAQLKNKVRLGNITRHILGLFQGQKGAAAFRRYISEHAHKKEVGVEVLENALMCVE